MAGRPDKYCYECAAVLPRTAVTCFSCSAAQPDLPDNGAPARPPGAEKICTTCGASILARAEICVKCGVRQIPAPAVTPVTPPAPDASVPPAAAGGWDLSHALLALGVLLVVAMAMLSRNESPSPASGATPTASASPAGITETDAWAAARRLVTLHLRAPPNVEFPSEHRTLRQGPDTFEVTSYFEMENTSGKMVRTHWTVVVAYIRGEWQVQRLEARN